MTSKVTNAKCRSAYWMRQFIQDSSNSLNKRTLATLLKLLERLYLILFAFSFFKMGSSELRISENLNWSDPNTAQSAKFTYTSCNIDLFFIFALITEVHLHCF